MKLNPNLDRNKVLDCDRKAVLKLPSGALHLWLCLWMNENATQQSYMSLERIMEQTGLTDKTITKWRRYLLKHGWLAETGETAADMYAKVTRGANKVLVYRVDDPTSGNIPVESTGPTGNIPSTGNSPPPKNSGQDSVSVSDSVSSFASALLTGSLSPASQAADQELRSSNLKPLTPTTATTTEPWASPTPTGGEPPDPPCGRMGVQGLDGEEYIHHYKDSKGRDKTCRAKAKPEFMALKSDTPCSVCKQPLGDFGSGLAAHEKCGSDQKRCERFWLKGKVDYSAIDSPPSPAAPPAAKRHPNAAVFQELRDKAENAGKKKQYFPDGAAYPDSWYRLSDEEKRLLIKQHTRKEHTKISIS